MGKRIPVELNGVTYPTKKTAAEAIRNILYGREKYRPLTGDDHELLLSLLARHADYAEKAGVGISHFEIRDNKVNGGATTGFWVVRTDGTAVDFSYRWALDARHRTLIEDIASAARHAMFPNLHEAKRELFAARSNDDNLMRCELSGRWCAFSEMHIDHAPPTSFQSVLHAWIASERLKGNEPSTDWIHQHGADGLVTEFATPALAQSFVDFHNTLTSATRSLRLVDADRHRRLKGQHRPKVKAPLVLRSATTGVGLGINKD